MLKSVKELYENFGNPNPQDKKIVAAAGIGSGAILAGTQPGKDLVSSVATQTKENVGNLGKYASDNIKKPSDKDSSNATTSNTSTSNTSTSNNSNINTSNKDAESEKKDITKTKGYQRLAKDRSDSIEKEDAETHHIASQIKRTQADYDARVKNYNNSGFWDKWSTDNPSSDSEKKKHEESIKELHNKLLDKTSSNSHADADIKYNTAKNAQKTLDDATSSYDSIYKSLSDSFIYNGKLKPIFNNKG